MATLHLPLKGEWYEMIERGEKTEEYRDIKQRWIKPMCNVRKQNPTFAKENCTGRGCEGCFLLNSNRDNLTDFCYQYDAVCLHYGYTRRTMTFEVESITIGRGRPEWGAPDCDVFVIKLGRRIV